jgi:hypothetical protein
VSEDQEGPTPRPDESTGPLDGLQALARILGLRDKFLADLLFDPNDWSFVVKAHALLETIVCTLLATHLRKQELELVLAEEVEMSARIEMTKALELTTSEDRKMMHALGKLRNRLVHNAKDTGFTFDELFRNRDARRNFTETFGHVWSDPVGGTEPPVSRVDFVEQNPKLAIFASVNKIAMDVAREASKRRTEVAMEGLRRAILATPDK